ncbi:Multiple antibiotic resistance protein MarA [Caulifigura coniformis]|uniref:Multiple antibiotic resistance protein MarA n=1 Tax=Caulifigura coniformis TaxID=2527983 RepID=A0A517S9R4_9PLAN|nr:AraC family transcriptional regulator [Caulifigura coniformis]QDT52852.1 Multiple antibiotic resistance protein MarA [Caulifigura coniformis]
MPEKPSLLFAKTQTAKADAHASFRDEFYSRLSPGSALQDVFEHLSGVHFFLKNHDGRTIAFNSLLRTRLGLPDDEDVTGMTDYDLFPLRQADHYREDDRRVLATGLPLINRIEAWRNENPVVTSKYPVRDVEGRVIGVMGMFQCLSERRSVLSEEDELKCAVDYIRDHLHERLTVEQIADRAFLSARQLRRKFGLRFGISIQEYVIRLRIEAAGQELRNSTAPIAEIANRFGFCDQAAFTHHFRRRMGVTPRKYRSDAG